MPGAGGHHPDQAERAHRGFAQSRRHWQHHHAGRHSLRNELLHRTVDPPQEIQTHHQHLLRRCARSGIPTSDVFTHSYKVFAYTFGPNRARGGWKIVKERKVLPFAAPPKCGTLWRLVFLGGCFPYPFIVFMSLPISEWCCWQERYELFSRQAPLNICTEVQACHVFRKTTSRLYFSVQMWRLQLILLHFRTKPCFVMTQKLTKTVIVKMRWNKEK